MLNFRDVMSAVKPYIRDIDNAFYACDAVLALIPKESDTLPEGLDPLQAQAMMSVEALVFIATRKGAVLRAMQGDNKILAIKELRTFTGSNLKSAKDAIESDAVREAAAAYCCVECTPDV